MFNNNDSASYYFQILGRYVRCDIPKTCSNLNYGFSCIYSKINENKIH